MYIFNFTLLFLDINTLSLDKRLSMRHNVAVKTGLLLISLQKSLTDLHLFNKKVSFETIFLFADTYLFKDNINGSTKLSFEKIMIFCANTFSIQSQQ